jgi:F-type H+-transporting ATPase subunit a
MTLAFELDVNHLFFWDPIWFKGTVFEINRVVLLMFVASLLCIGFFLYGAAKKRMVPKGAQNLAETGYLFVRNQIAVDVIGSKEGPKYADYLASLFFFILFCNVLAIVPGIHFAATARMAIPFFLAMLTYLVFNISGIVKQGPIKYFKNTVVLPGVPWWVHFLLIPIETFSVFIVRPLTLMVRLLANMMAGHVLLTIFFLFTADLLKPAISAPLGLVTLAAAVVLMMLEMLVIVMQAYIFTMLSAFYIAEAIHGHGDEPHVEHEATPSGEHKETPHETELAAA